MAPMPTQKSIAILTPRTAEASKILKKTFRESDKNGSGTISEADLADTLSRIGGFSSSQIKVLCQEVEKNEDGEVAYDDFVDWVMRPTSHVKLVDGEAKMFDWDDCFRPLFRVYDRNGDGSITIDEMKECHSILEGAMKKTHFDEKTRKTMEAVTVEFMKADKDNNDEVDFQEFVEWQRQAVKHSGLTNQQVGDLISKLAEILNHVFEIGLQSKKDTKVTSKKKYPELKGLQKELADVEKKLWSKKEPVALNTMGQRAGYTSSWTEPPPGMSAQHLIHEHMKVPVPISDVKDVEITVPLCLPEANGEGYELQEPRRWIAKVVRKVTTNDGKESNSSYFYAFADGTWVLQPHSQDFDAAEMDLAPALRLLCVFMTKADFRSDPLSWKATQDAFRLAQDMGLVTQTDTDKFNKFMAGVASEMLYKFHGNSKSEEEMNSIVSDFLESELTLGPLNVMAELASLGLVRKFALWEDTPTQDQESPEKKEALCSPPDSPPPVRRKEKRHATWHPQESKVQEGAGRGHGRSSIEHGRSSIGRSSIERSTTERSSMEGRMKALPASLKDFDAGIMKDRRLSDAMPELPSELPRIDRGVTRRRTENKGLAHLPGAFGEEPSGSGRRSTSKPRDSLRAASPPTIGRQMSTGSAASGVGRARSPSPAVDAVDGSPTDDAGSQPTMEELPAVRRKSERKRTNKMTKFEKQCAALQSLVLELGPSTELRELVGHVTRHVLARDGHKAYCDAKLDAAFLEAIGQSPPPLEEGASGPLGRATTLPSDAPEEDDDKAQKHAAKTTKRLLEVLRVLVDRNPSIMPLNECVGQILWRFRRNKKLKDDHHWIAHDASWIPGADEVLREIIEENELEAGLQGNLVDHVEVVFQILTRRTDGRMRWRDIQKVTKLIQSNPILRARFSAQLMDQLFFVEQKRDNTNWSISMTEFKEMLLTIAQVIEVHPFMVFYTLGSHAERMLTDLGEDPKDLKSGALLDVPSTKASEGKGGSPNPSKRFSLRTPTPSVASAASS